MLTMSKSRFTTSYKAHAHIGFVSHWVCRTSVHVDKKTHLWAFPFLISILFLNNGRALGKYFALKHDKAHNRYSSLKMLMSLFLDLPRLSDLVD